MRNEKIKGTEVLENKGFYSICDHEVYFFMKSITLFCCIFVGDGPDLRDYVIKCGVIEPLLNLIKPETPVNICLLSIIPLFLVSFNHFSTK